MTAAPLAACPEPPLARETGRIDDQRRRVVNSQSFHVDNHVVICRVFQPGLKIPPCKLLGTLIMFEY